MIEKKKPKTDCYFCCYENIKDEGRVIFPEKENKDEEWYAFIPLEPEIFGHIIVTYASEDDKSPNIKKSEFPCQNIICKEDNHNVSNIKKDKRDEILKVLDKGVITIVDGLKKIKNVDKVYFAMLGETKRTHMHYHLFPRYGFVNEYELNNWANKDDYTLLSEGNIRWKKFYANPTSGFKSFDGFQYLGEIENSYQRAEKSIGKPPTEELLEEMAEKIKKRCKF
ncbi:MAG: hypothetical protein MUO82_02445 [Candidatus Thermoplasmatota archaeon]|nr:hypothetical protein [Candidatus Thermoplasmatota archaeon]